VAGKVVQVVPAPTSPLFDETARCAGLIRAVLSGSRRRLPVRALRPGRARSLSARGSSSSALAMSARTWSRRRSSARRRRSYAPAQPPGWRSSSGMRRSRCR
jgi:hypothetical protein